MRKTYYTIEGVWPGEVVEVYHFGFPGDEEQVCITSYPNEAPHASVVLSKDAARELGERLLELAKA